MTTTIDWPSYIAQMSLLLDLQLPPDRQAELAIELSRIAEIAAPLMAYPLDDRQEVGGVWKL
ncbi:oxalurate catabolism protein HpxX [Tatumella sp. TA1]|uniref:oxalurate catabolism protein HpxX n=1 Tax=Rosenbergiella collisarenosi TaxID=1544695 RepID=UPI0008F854EE|nr:oxalurate catabolism protein HpxX [Rosenbergiella collisarenosi]MBT0722655.1 oxalurate catabolism protein HpxX [Rosenbergiella collisarenosi]QGX92168.1 oxalurate catabolism protein HpxX [Tatumella sp. TA1]